MNYNDYKISLFRNYIKKIPNLHKLNSRFTWKENRARMRVRMKRKQSVNEGRQSENEKQNDEFLIQKEE